ncbi:MAG: Y_Y_Y domain protein [Bacteroidetes bacterium ADurb.Bin408]|nr:MAG: Y_Y_Y domain protein [Bacteroidetes bacterium ADurb.Bin408]
MPDNHHTYIYSTDKLYLYNNDYPKNFGNVYHALIRKVSLNGDSVIFNGSFYKKDVSSSKRIVTTEQLPKSVLNIDYTYNNIHFEWSAPFFEAEEETEYSYFLKSNDEGWSNWSKRSDKEYTNLFKGSYAFHVKARNIYGTESLTATYRFVILSPWYRTLWAYLVYIALFYSLYGVL